jgi:hypothetical protein
MLARWVAEGYDAVAALAGGARFPPVIGRAGEDKLVLIDGVHRLVAHAALGRERVRAYEPLASFA